MTDVLVDQQGRRCPLPVIELARAARTAPSGSRLVLLATDPATRHDVPAWCRMRGHTLIEITEDGGVLRFVVVVA